MKRCPECKQELPDGELKCPRCERSIDETSGATAFLPGGDEKAVSIHSTESADGARFAAGTMLAGRYRIVSLLGRGGMGEVYKAEDLKLKQIVALKFLPEMLTADGAALARFHNEVRITRQISHPNVCRVYDIADAGGMHFLSMEYIDGEDLSLLLRRIGRLPGDKAAEIARQISAGLAAAHDNGVLHRDLKPPNIMIDGRGRARVTDFGVAVVAKQLRGIEALSGTAAYMAPEQLRGEEVTQRSDIYSLGLVLYELFTGKRVYDSDNVNELRRLHDESSPTSPSSHIHNIDPLVERVILRCLEKDPKDRPASALQVAAALPGGDPLAAALAAGETPSPEMVAASGENIGLRPWIAAVLLGGIIVGIVTAAVLGGIADWKTRAVRENSPQDLAVKSRDIAAKLGYTNPPADSAFGFSSGSAETEQVDYIKEHSAPGADLWDLIVSQRPSPIKFWYRQSPQYLQPVETTSFGSVTESDPSTNAIPGMISISLEPNGTLRKFQAMPPERRIPQAADAPAPDWAQLFGLAGLDLSNFTPAEPLWTLGRHSDVQASWTGSYPGQPDQPIRVSAASYAGKTVSFFIDQPWDAPPLAEIPPAGVTAGLVSFMLFAFFFLALTIAAIWLARINIRRGRGDRRGAARLAFLLFALTLISWIFGADHNAAPDAFIALIQIAIPGSLLAGAFVWLVYMALEPHIRRRWPETIISWTRAVGGDVRNALVGRDVLIGVAAGVSTSVLTFSENVIRVNGGSFPTSTNHLGGLLDTRRFIAAGVVTPINAAVIISLFMFLFVCLPRLITRRRWLAGVLFVALNPLVAVIGSTDLYIALPGRIAFYTLIAVVMLRFGLLPMVVCSFVTFLLGFAHVSTDFTAWYSGYTIAGVVIVLGLAGWAYHTSLGGERLFREGFLEE